MALTPAMLRIAPLFPSLPLRAGSSLLSGQALVAGNLWLHLARQERDKGLFSSPFGRGARGEGLFSSPFGACPERSQASPGGGTICNFVKVLAAQELAGLAIPDRLRYNPVG